MNTLLQSLPQDTLWLFVIGLVMLIVTSIAFLIAHSRSARVKRARKRRELEKLLRDHVNEHYRQFDGHMWDLERELHANLKGQLEALRLDSAMPPAIRPIQSKSATTD